MTTILLRTLLAAGFALFAARAAADPYLVLREAYAKRDATAAAQAYAPDAVYIERYAGSKEVVRRGGTAIEKGFAEIFAHFGPQGDAPPLDLNFRFESRAPGTDGADKGVYRLKVRIAGKTESYYGRFAATRRAGRFVEDTSSDGTRADFERLAGPVAFDAEAETLDSAYYDDLLGRYADASGCALLITRSARRFFALDECAKTWRALTRVDGLNWTAGSAVWSESANAVLRFTNGRLVVEGKDSKSVERMGGPTREAVRFSSDGVELAGTLYRPAKPSAQAPGVVLIHGSGPQDRHGYASLIDLLATRFAEKGFVALAYDKRGVGESGGDWSRAGFDQLGADAAAAMRFLRRTHGVDPKRVGFAGSSQAGWVAARSVRDGSDPAFVLLIGAAGTAMTVEEQNLYNTDVRMRCAGFSPRERKLALDQQRAFFAAKRDKRAAPRLATATRKAQETPRLADWLFPGAVSTEPTGEWYDVLDPDFDPLPVWNAYRGAAYFLFGGKDDSTPTEVATRRLKRVPGLEIAVIDGAQHIGLRADDLCKSDLEFVDGFHEQFDAVMTRWMERIAGGAEGGA
jgi:hypothetical protein